MRDSRGPSSASPPSLTRAGGSRLRALGLVLLLLLTLVVSATPATAHHPGSNQGLARFLPLEASTPGARLVHHWPDIDDTFGRWAERHPDLIHRFSIGETSTGFELFGVRLTDESVEDGAANTPNGTKYRVYLDGGHHGNEYLGVELIMYYLEEMLDLAVEGDEATREFLRTTEVYAVPIINVDGNSADTRKNAQLVDPNRNYPYEWGGPGSGDSPADLTYRGPEPLSEAETAANAAFAAALRPDLWITMHTGVAEFYWPWGWTHDPTPDDDFFTSLERPFEEATSGRVDAMMAAELYLAAGATDDFGYGALGIPTFTYEVHEDQFIPVYGQPIPEIIQHQLAGLDFMVKNVQHMGGRIEPHVGHHAVLAASRLGLELPDNVEENQLLVLENIGWGNVTGLTVTNAATGDVIVADRTLERGDGLGIQGAPEGWTLAIEYQPLLIETAKPHHLRVSIPSEDTFDDFVPSLPAAGPVSIGMAGLALFALARRRP